MNQFRADAVKLINEIPEDRLPFVRALLRAVLEEEGIAVIEPCHDDELTEEERAGIKASQADIQAGRVYAWDEIKKELGI